MSAPGLRESVQQGVVRWELDQPLRRNAIGPEALRWIARRCDELRGETVVLRGAGELAFCAGFDLTALRPRADGPPPDAPLAEASAAMQAADATFLAAINGFTIGAGLELACACDIRIAREDAWFSVPAGRLGVVYHPHGVRLLHQVLGSALTRRLLLLGERVDAHSLRAAGALTHVVSPAELDETVEAAVTAIRTGATAVAAAHRGLLRVLEQGTLDDDALQAYAVARAQAYARLGDP